MVNQERLLSSTAATNDHFVNDDRLVIFTTSSLKPEEPPCITQEKEKQTLSVVAGH